MVQNGEMANNNQSDMLNKALIKPSKQPRNLTIMSPLPVDESNLSPKKLSTFMDIKKLIADMESKSVLL